MNVPGPSSPAVVAFRCFSCRPGQRLCFCFLGDKLGLRLTVVPDLRGAEGRRAVSCCVIVLRAMTLCFFFFQHSALTDEACVSYCWSPLPLKAVRCELCA